MFKSKTYVGALVGALALTACASDGANRDPASYGELKDQELEAERREYIVETQERLSKLSNDISRLDARLKHEAEFVDGEQKADWSQELFELQQQRDQLQAELERAQTVNLEEWKEMRGTVGVATDSLEAGVEKLYREVASTVGDDDDAAEGSAQGGTQSAQGVSGLCSANLGDDVDAEIEERDDSLLVVMTTSDSKQVAALKDNGRQLEKQEQYPKQRPQQQGDSSKAAADDEARSAEAKSDASEPVQSEPVQVEITMEEIEDGVRLQFQPKNGRQDLKRLRVYLERDIEALDDGRCQATARVSQASTSQR